MGANADFLQDQYLPELQYWCWYLSSTALFTSIDTYCYNLSVVMPLSWTTAWALMHSILSQYILFLCADIALLLDFGAIHLWTSVWLMVPPICTIPSSVNAYAYLPRHLCVQRGDAFQAWLPL